MAGENAAGTVTGMPKADADAAQKRERSSIAFPYNDLDDAIEMAHAIHDNVGLGTCDDDQLAAYLKLSSKSSGYRVQLSAARMFGILESETDQHKLSDLGRRIVDPKQAREAKAEAFLNVPLYSAVYEKYKGGVLPPPAALERDIVGLGVAEKQKDRARQVLERSADQAGFFEQGQDRLIKPGISVRDESLEKKKKKDGNGNGSGPHDPLINALIEKLPAAGPWTADDRVLWLQMFVMAAQIAYGAVEPIEVRKASAST